MVEELGYLFRACPPTSDMSDYRKAIVEDNVLLKKTAGTRVKSYPETAPTIWVDSVCFCIQNNAGIVGCHRERSAATCSALCLERAIRFYAVLPI